MKTKTSKTININWLPFIGILMLFNILVPFMFYHWFLTLWFAAGSYFTWAAHRQSPGRTIWPYIIGVLFGPFSFCLFTWHGPNGEMSQEEKETKQIIKQDILNLFGAESISFQSPVKIVRKK